MESSKENKGDDWSVAIAYFSAPLLSFFLKGHLGFIPAAGLKRKSQECSHQSMERLTFFKPSGLNFGQVKTKMLSESKER